MPAEVDPVGTGDQGADPYVKTDLEILEGGDSENLEPKVEPGDDEVPPEPVEKPEKKEPVKKAPKSAEDDEEEKEEEDEEEEDDEDEEDEEEDEEDIEVPDKSPEYRDVKKKYPNLFKDFPGLRHDFFRVKAFDKIFTSVDEAKEVAERFDGLVQLENVVSSGNAENFVKGLGGFSKPALTKLATDFLPSLAKVDKELHNKVAGNVLASALRAAQAQARSAGNQNLFHAASHLSMFLWDSEQIPKEAPTSSPELDEQRKQLEEREQKFVTERQTEFVSEVKTTGERQLRKEISRGLDPDDVLPEFVKDSILDRCQAEVDAAMAQDEQHVKNMNATWERAARQGHGKDFKNRLIQLYIGRARSLVGPIRRKLVTEAIAKINKKPSNGAPSITPKKAVPGGKAPSSAANRPSPKDVDWGKTSDLDYLNRNITKR